MSFDPKQLPPEKQRGIVRDFGTSGRDWIASFPRLIDACIDRWDLTLLGTAAAGWHANVVYFAEGPGGEAWVLKVGHPHPEQVTEMIALARYAGRSTPRLIDSSRELGATLIERILPGTTFRHCREGITRSRISMALIGSLPAQCDYVKGLPLFDDWLERAFAEFRQCFPQRHGFRHHVDRAEIEYDDLRARYPDNWLLHGDLHHENILLDGERGWLAIDPKGVIGPKPMECGRFLHNFMEDEIDGASTFMEASIDQLCHVLDVRLDTFASTLGMSRRDLAQANYVDAVLSFCWTVNSQPDYCDFQPVDASLAMLAS